MNLCGWRAACLAQGVPGAPHAVRPRIQEPTSERGVSDTAKSNWMDKALYGRIAGDPSEELAHFAQQLQFHSKARAWRGSKQLIERLALLVANANILTIQRVPYISTCWPCR